MCLFLDLWLINSIEKLVEDSYITAYLFSGTWLFITIVIKYDNALIITKTKIIVILNFELLIKYNIFIFNCKMSVQFTNVDYKVYLQAAPIFHKNS
jgi:hypothetical protein